MLEPLLLPRPRKLELVPGWLQLVADKLVVIDAQEPGSLLFTALRWKNILLKLTKLHWGITASNIVPANQVGLILRVNPEKVSKNQGYELIVDSTSIRISGADEAGVFYGVCTLIQLLEQPIQSTEFSLPLIKVVDYPDFSARGVMLDVSRDKVPTLDTVCRLVDRLAGWKINQLQLYTEHTFAYSHHPVVWEKASPFTGEEILILDRYCRERYVELVPNQNSFGHMHRWLVHPQYRSLAECPNGIDYPWGGHSDEPFSLCPVDQGSIQLIRDMYDELLPHFTSDKFNVGCDETWDLGKCRSEDECNTRGVGRVYLDFLLKIYREVRSRGKRMQFWGDIIIQHPELVAELPQDVIALEWGYDANHPFDEHCAQFAAAGLDFYVCPGTSSWNTMAGRTDNALRNLISAAESGLKHRAIGYLNTDWGDNGHWQPLPVSYLGFAAGAAYSWSVEENCKIDIAKGVGLYGFDDASGNLGKVAYDLGNVYRMIGYEPGNASGLFIALQSTFDKLKDYQDNINPEEIQRALASIDTAMTSLPSARSSSQDSALIQQEFQFVARTLRHACNKLLFLFDSGDKTTDNLIVDLLEIIREYKSIWLARNRPGGLDDSVARFEKILVDYQNHKS